MSVISEEKSVASQASFINNGGSGMVRSNSLLKSACFAAPDYNDFVEERKPFFDDEMDDGQAKV